MRTFILFPGLLLAAALSAQTTVSGTIQSGGLTREYLLYVPAVYNPAIAVPLVINLHGYTSNNLAQELYGDFRPIADTANFLIVHPNGTVDGQGNRFWNTFGGPSTVDDVGFIANLIDSLRAVYNLDPNRIYATGMSNGGFMSYALACELNDRIAAIASVTGSMIGPNLAACHPARPVPVMEIHGTADNTVPYNGSVASGFTPIPTLVAAWVNFNHCNPSPTVTQVPNINTADGCTAEHSVYTGGDLGSTVEHYKIIGGGHTWPGAIFNIGVTNQDINASWEIWRFFRQYQLDELTATQEIGNTAPVWRAFPNPADDYLFLQPTVAGTTAERVGVYDAAGRLVQSMAIAPGESKLRLSTAGWANGTYTVVLESNDQTEKIRVVKQRP
ncbi:MAG: PHB depolymerase family esterase [Saprospiraceae bacterium]